MDYVNPTLRHSAALYSYARLEESLNEAEPTHSCQYTPEALEQKYQEAKSCELGNGRPRDLALAFTLYETLAQVGHIPALVDTAACLCHGMGTKIDLSRSAKLANGALSQNLTPQQKGQVFCLLGILFEKGYFEEDKWIQGSGKAQHFFELSHNLGDLFGGANLALHYLRKTDPDQAKNIMLTLLDSIFQQAKQNHPLAQTLLGSCHTYGLGVLKDLKVAASWYEQAAYLDYAQAQYYLGYCFLKELGVEQDEDKAFFWFQKAAGQNDARAQCNVGDCYTSATGVNRNIANAVIYYKNAAQQGYLVAQCKDRKSTRLNSSHRL